MNVPNKTLEPLGTIAAPLSLVHLDDEANRIVQAFVDAGVAANTRRSYASAIRYWQGWFALRYGQDLRAAPLPTAAVLQFVIDHLHLPGDSATPALPGPLEDALVAQGIKAQPGALSFNTVSHRLVVLSAWHRLQDWPSPTEAATVKALMRSARKAQARAGMRVRKKTAAVGEPLAAMLATCTDGLRGTRDRALLHLAWSGGGRRRSEVVALQVQDLTRLDEHTWTYRLGATKTQADGHSRDKPLRGPAVAAMRQWLTEAGLNEGPVFRRLRRGGHLGADAMTPDHLARMVKRRAALAGLPGDWAGHSLRSGYVTEAGRQGVPLGDVMAMTEHRTAGIVMGYFQAGSLLTSTASALQLPPDPTYSPALAEPDTD